jgi:hypothetical protein
MRLTLRFYFIRGMQGTVSRRAKAARVRSVPVGTKSIALPRSPSAVDNKKGRATHPVRFVPGMDRAPENCSMAPTGTLETKPQSELDNAWQIVLSVNHAKV